MACSLGLFLTGLAGSTVHCAPMCGGFVLGQAADRMARLPAAACANGAASESGLLLPFHVGRLSTYAALGALAGSPAGLLARSPAFASVSAALLVAAAAAFLWHVRPLIGAGGGRAPAPPSRASAVVLRLARRIGRRHAAGGVLLGAALGLLPCGFLYGALFAAAGAGSTALGAAAMLCFGLGTVPVLVLTALAGHAVRFRWRTGRRRLRRRCWWSGTCPCCSATLGCNSPNPGDRRGSVHILPKP